jgi:peptidoglycan/xylan/chitin deacetylase (PgdA/CDA1 family)
MLSALETGVSIGIGALAGLGIVGGVCACAAMLPGPQLFGRTLSAPTRPGELALTFDDGPNPACTPRLLDLLALHNARATFFLLGSFAAQEPALVRRIAAAHHLIGNHSWSHPNLAIASSRKVVEELMRTQETLQQITGARIRYFRPPFGARRPHVLRTAKRMGMTPVLWNAMTSDWKEASAKAIADRLIHRIDTLQKRGHAANIVLHDGGHRQLGSDRNASVTAAGQLLTHYKSTHRFVTLDAWGESARPQTVSLARS